MINVDLVFASVVSLRLSPRILLTIANLHSDVHSWHHYALVWSGQSGIFQLYVDGELWATAYFEFSKGNAFESGGTLVIGQLQVIAKYLTINV